MPNCGHLPGYVQVDLGFAHEFAGWGCALTFFIVGNLGRVAFDEEEVWPHTRRPLPVLVSMLDACEHRDRQTPPYLGGDCFARYIGVIWLHYRALRRGLASSRLFSSLDRCQAFSISSNSRICPLSIRGRLIFFVSGVKTNFQLAPEIASIRAIGQSSANKSFLVGHRGFPAIAEIAPRLRIAMPFSRVHFPIPWIRAPHTAVVYPSCEI